MKAVQYLHAIHVLECKSMSHIFCFLFRLTPLWHIVHTYLVYNGLENKGVELTLWVQNGCRDGSELSDQGFSESKCGASRRVGWSKCSLGRIPRTLRVFSMEASEVKLFEKKNNY